MILDIILALPDFNDGISRMRDQGIFEKLSSEGIPLYALEEAAEMAIDDEEGEETEKLNLEAFYGPMFIHCIGIVLGIASWILETLGKTPMLALL